jgi:fused signal recognition particle receptor
MFDSLKERLKQVSGKIGNSIAARPAEPGEGEPAKKTQGLGGRVRVLVTEGGLVIGEKELADALGDLEMVLLENDVALPVTDAVIARVKERLIGTTRRIGEPVEEIVSQALRGALLDVLGQGFDLLSFVRSHEFPVKVLFTGVNGTGKTTTVAKIGYFLKNNGVSVVIAAGDTYRAGAFEQIDIHAHRLGIKIIHHQEGADPSAVIFDAIQYAKAHNVQVVLADTAGRFHNRVNLMNQLSKIRRVMTPDLIVYVDEAVAGNDAVTRAYEFDRAVGADTVVLTKADMDARGGAAISIAHTIGKPVMFLGTGQGYEDIVPFDPGRIVDDLVGVSG